RSSGFILRTSLVSWTASAAVNVASGEHYRLRVWERPSGSCSLRKRSRTFQKTVRPKASSSRDRRSWLCSTDSP
ncbi:hypothetical protein M9458_022969, partial [Cirrhinus mrigala]